MNARALFTMAIVVGTTVAACALGACDKKDTSPSTSSSSASALTDKDVPVPADFADEAATQITKDNYKSELDQLAGEIDKD